MSDLTANFQWLGIEYQLTNVQTLIENISTIQEQQLNSVMNQYIDKLNVDTADGVWLDYLGYRLGVLQRPSVAPSAEFFGFDTNGVGFDQAPFKSESDDRVPIDDGLFRKFLKNRAFQLISNTTADDIITALKLVFDEVTVIDEYNMTMCVFVTTTSSVQVVQALVDDGVIPKPAGVRAYGQLVSPPVFGFDADGEGFDQAPFVMEFSI